MSKDESISRRAFLKRAGAAAAVAATGSIFASKLFGQTDERKTPTREGRSRVVIATNRKAIHEYEADAQQVSRTLERGLQTLTGKNTGADAWRQFVTPKDVVGLKISTSGGPSFSTHAALVSAVIAGLQSAGVPAENIVVWDRTAEPMWKAGFTVDAIPDQLGAAPPVTGRPHFIATVPHAGYDKDVFYESNLAGRLMWDDLDFSKNELGTRSHYSNIVTRRVTKLICLPVMAESRDSGLAGALFTMASGAVDNTRRFAGPPFYFDPGAAEICAKPVIKDKWRLTIGDGLLAQYFGGPSFHPQYCWHNAALYLSADPVATDAVMLEQIELMRAQYKLDPVADRAQHIQSAAAYELGHADPALIDKVSIQF